MQTKYKSLITAIVLLVVLLVGLNIYNKKFPKTVQKAVDKVTGKVEAPEGQLTPNFPKELVPPKDIQILSSSVTKVSGVELNTTIFQSTKPLKDVYGFYLQYISRQGYLITNNKLGDKVANIYGARNDIDVNAVMSKQNNTVVATVSYTIKNQK